MYLTRQQELTIAQAAWEQAVKTLEALGRKMEQVERKAMKSNGEDYCAEIEQIELLRVQYEAVLALKDSRWERMQALSDSLQAA